MGAEVYAFAGSSAGGHLVPGLAIADELRKRRPQAEVLFLTTGHAFDRELLANHGYRRFEQSIRDYPSRPWHWPGYWLAARWSDAACRSLFRRERPRAIIGLGGLASTAGIVAARTLKIPSLILNPDAIPGRTNRRLATKADLVVMQWEASRTYFSPEANCQPWGCPIRAPFARLAARALRQTPEPSENDDAATVAPPSDGLGDSRQIFELAWSRPVLLVSGATLGARGLNEAARRAWPEFSRQHPEWQLLHLAGETDAPAAIHAYESAGIRRDGWRVLTYTPEMWHAIAAADVVVSRAGASTIAELTTLGKPSVLFPAAAGPEQDQSANARVLVERGGAVRIEESPIAARNAEALSAALEQLSQRPLRVAMADAARKLARPNATDKIVEWILKADSGAA